MQMVLTGIMLCVVIFSSIYWSFYVEDIKYEKVENEMMPFERIYIEENMHEALLNNNRPVDIPEINDSIALICYYSSLSCTSCINYAQNKLNEYFAGKSYPIYYIEVGFNENKTKKEGVISWMRDKINLPITESLHVFYFLWKGGHLTNVFIPNESYENYTDVYLSGIQGQYFNH